MRMQISIFLQLMNAIFIFLFLFPSGTNSVSIFPEFLSFYIAQRRFAQDPLAEGRASKILNVHYRNYLFSKDIQESMNSKLRISITSNIYLIYQIAEEKKDQNRLMDVLLGIFGDSFSSYYRDSELGLCKMLKYRQKVDDFMKGRKSKSSKKGVEMERRVGVKMELNESKDWIREADFTMFLYFFYTPENWQFHIMLKNFLNQANELEIAELRKRFVKLFGLARMVQLALHYPYPQIFGKIMNPNGDGQKEFETKMVVKLIQEYLEIKRPNNLIKKWTIRYVLNYLLYKNWWQKYEEKNFKGEKMNPAKLWEKAFEEYWAGENVLRWEMKMNGLAKIKMEEKGKEKEKIQKAKALFQDMKDNFLDTESFAKEQLLVKGSYLEGAKEMTEQILKFISTGIRESRWSKLKFEKKMNEKEMEEFWVKCVNVNLNYVAENLMGQKEMYMEAMINLMKERAGKGEFEFIWQSPTIYRDENFKDLFNYEKSEFLSKFSMKINNINLEEKNDQIDKTKEISPLIGNPIYPGKTEKVKEMEIKVVEKDQLIEQAKAKTEEKILLEEKKRNLEKSTKKGGNGAAISSVKKVEKVKQFSSIVKKIEQFKIDDEKAKKEEREKIKRKKEAEERRKKEEEERKKKEEEEEKKAKLEEEKRSGNEKNLNNRQEIELEEKYGGMMMMKKNRGGKKKEEKIPEKEESLSEMMEQNYLEKFVNLKYLFLIAKNDELILGKQIEQFYSIFIAEENEENLTKLIEFLNICILVKIIEQNFKAFSMITEQGIPLKNGGKMRNKRWRENLTEWKKFKEANLKNGEKIEGKLVEEIFKKWEKYSKRRNGKEEEMEEILGKMHFNELALMIGKEAKINEFGIKMGDGEFEKNSRKYGEKMGEQFFRRLGQIMPKMMIGGEKENGWEQLGKKFVDQIKVKMEMVYQLKLEENIKEKFVNLIKTIEIEKRMKPAKWLDLRFYEISSAENWQKINLKGGEILEDYLKEIYEFDLMAEGMKENAKEWLRQQMEEWMRMKMTHINGGEEYLEEIYGFDLMTEIKENAKECLRQQMEEWMRMKMAHINGGKVDYSMAIGGSTLIGTAMANSDLDILFLVPKLSQNPSEDILESFYLYLKEAIKNEAELNKFGLMQRDARLQWIEPKPRVPSLIKLRIDFVDLDIMMAQIPLEKIPPNWTGFSLKKLQLENSENEENIQFNIFFMDFVIENLLNENEVGGGIHQKGDIYSLASYRSTYRQKFVWIEKSRREIFTQLLRAVKYWAKRQHIYSNQFGYLSGTSLTLMATKICILYPTGDLPFLLEKFFFIYATWPWPKPLLLEELMPKEIVEKYKIKLEYWEPTRIEKDGEMMPIITAMFPEGNSAFNVNEIGRKVIKSKMVKAYQMIVENEENCGSNNFWKEHFFREFDYENYFEDFLLIICSAENFKNSTCGWIKNKIRHILSDWMDKSKYEEIVKVELKNVLEEYQIISDFERKGECVKIENNECVGWLVGLKFLKDTKSNFKENHKLKFWGDLRGIFINDYNYYRKTHKIEIFHSMSAELKENISSFILEKKFDEIDEEKIKELKLKGKQKIEEQRKNRPLNPNAEPYFPQYIVQQWMSEFYSTYSYYYPQQFYYYYLF